MKGRILQLHTSIPLKCETSCLFIKLKLGRVGMGRVLHLGPSWHGPSFMWAKLAWAELVLGRVVLHPHQQPWHICVTISALYQCVKKCSQCVVIKFLNKTLASLPRKKIQSGNRFLDVIT